MTLIYYRNSSGKIYRCEEKSSEYSMEEILDRIQDFNKGHDGKAYLEVVADDSLAAYLYRQMHIQPELDCSDLEDIIYACEEALDKARSLRLSIRKGR